MMHRNTPTGEDDVRARSVGEMLAMEGSGWDGDLDAMRADGHGEQWVDTRDLRELWDLPPDPTLEPDVEGSER